MRVVLSGGGSGGHIYPALAIARGLRAYDDNLELLYIGTNHGLEKDLVPRANIAFATIHARGLLVRGVKGKVVGALTALRGVLDAFRILRGNRPDVVVGTGGYVSGPVGLVATWLHIPLVIQEQNAWPGLTNRSLAKRAYAVLVPFDEAVQHFPVGTRVLIAGNPVDVPIERFTRDAARKELALNSDLRLLMATGGSQGALRVNQVMLDLMPKILEDPQLGMIWATGKRYYGQVMETVKARYGDDLDTRRIQIYEYFYQIQTVYQAADLFLGRAGAMTLTDCQAFGVPTVLIPSPHVSEDHQTKNAAVIQSRGAGISIAESVLGERSDEIIALLKDRERTGKMAENISALFDADALERIVETILEAPRTSGRR